MKSVGGQAMLSADDRGLTWGFQSLDARTATQTTSASSSKFDAEVADRNPERSSMDRPRLEPATDGFESRRKPSKEPTQALYQNKYIYQS